MSYLPRTLMLACALASTSAFANDTITFEGEITDQTCEVMINGQKNAVVMLPVVSQESLKSANSSAGLTSFDVQLTKCNDTSGQQKAKLKFTAPQVTEGKNLANILGKKGAQNVAVQLVADAEGQKPVSFENNIGISSVEFDLASSKESSHKFYAHYVKEGAENVTPGAVKAVVEYTLSYL